MEETEKISRGGQKRDTASIIYKSRRLWGMDHGLGTDRTVRRSPKVTEKWYSSIDHTWLCINLPQQLYPYLVQISRQTENDIIRRKLPIFCYSSVWCPQWNSIKGLIWPQREKTTARKLLYAAALIADDCSQSLQCNTHRTAILVSHVLTR